MKKELQNKDKGLGFLRHWKVMTMTLLLLTFSIGQMGGADLEIPLTNLKVFPLDYGLVTITNTQNVNISSNQLQVNSKTGKFRVSTNLAGFYLKSISFTDASSSGKNGGFSCDENTSYMTESSKVYTYTAPNTTTTEANFTLIGSGGTAKMGTIIVTLSTSEQIERLSAFGSISEQKIPFTSSAATSNVELSVPTANAVSTSSSRISIGSGGKHLIVSTKNSKVLKNIIIPKYQQSTNEITGSSDPAGTYDKATNVWTPTASTNTSVDLTLTTTTTVYSQEIFVIYANAAPVTNYTVTINPNGGSYASTPDGWTYDSENDKYTKSVASGTSFSAPAGLSKGTDALTWKDGSSNDVTFPVSITGNITFVAQWTPVSAAPTISAHPSTADVLYIKDAAATALSVTASGSGTVTYQWYSNTTASNTDGTILENCTTATCTPSTAATGKLYYYCEVTNTETSKSPTTIKSNVSGLVRVVPAPTHLVENVMATSGSWDSYIVSANSHISNLKTIAASEGKTLIKSGKENASGDRTPGITSNSSATLVENDYIYIQFTIESGYELTISEISVPVFKIANSNGNYVARISDASNSIESEVLTLSQNGTGNPFNEYDFSSSPKLSGTVTLKLFAYGWSDGYRMESPVYIDGEVKAVGACTTPTIAWDGDQPENAYVSDGSKTFVMNSNYAAGIAPELSENTCGASIAVKPETDNKQWVVSFTSAGSVKITPKVVGDGTTVCAETVSGTAKTLTVTQAYDVTFNMNGHGASIAKQVVADGGKATTPYVADVADWVFGGWFTDAECTAGNEFDFANTTITADRPLYAKWTADACASERKSLSKVVLTSASEGTVSGHNGEEYAGAAVIAGLNGTQAADLGGGSVTGYKLSSGGSAIVFATLKKGSFQAGDKVVIGITKKQDTRELNGTKNLISIYYGTNASDAALLTTIYDVSAAGYYTYRLTEADATAIGEKKGIGVFRESSNGQNPHVYSVEITGCRSFAVTHDVTFDMKSHGTQVAKQTIEVGAKVTEPAEQEVAGYIFGGWYKETTLVNKWNFSTDVMPDNDITLYAKWTEDPCTDRQSLSKVVLTSATAGTVTGHNSNEYAGTAIIASLKDDSKTADIIGDANKEKGYKLNSGGNSIVMATLKKGDFQEGDKVTVGVILKNDQRTVDASTDILTLYAGSDKDHMMEVATIKNVSDPGFYTYRLTAADATAINAAGYKSIGLFRASSNGENHNIYSVEITGCRSWTTTHTVTYNKMGKGADIAPAVVAVGDLVPKPSVVEPDGWALVGWFKEEGLVNEWNFASDVMPDNNLTLYAKWEDETGVIKLFDGEGNLNTTNFVSAAKKDGGIDIDEVNYPCLVDFGSNRTSLNGTTQADVVQYNATTNTAKIKLDLYNNATGAKTAYLWMVEEGATESGDPIAINVPGKTRLITSYTSFNSEKPRSFYVTSGSKSDIKVLQVKVLDNGTDIPQFGKAGYAVNLNKGRIIAAANGTVPFDGATMHSNDAYTVLNSSNFKPKTYIQFNNAVANTTVKITKASSNKYYVTNDLDNKGDEYSTDQEIVLTTTGTWYIGSVNSSSVAALSKIEFVAPKCEEPTITTQPATKLDFGAGNLTATVVAEVSDGGTLSYQWYNASDDSEVSGADEATLTTTTEGTYYVIVTNTLANHTDNSIKSNNATLGYRTIDDATLSALSYGTPATAIALEADKYTYRIILDEGTTDVPELHATATMEAYGATADVTDATVFTDYRATSTVLVRAEDGTTTQTYTVTFVVQHIYTVMEDVTESTTWNWTGVEASDVDINDVANRGVILGNYIGGSNFEMMEGKAGEKAFRDQNGGVYQGTYLHFNTTVPGRVKFYFRAPSGGENCTITVKNGGRTVVAGTRPNSFGWSDEVFVNGDVVVEMVNDKEGGGTTRVQQVVFTTADPNYTRPVTEGRFGTICLPNGGVMVGAALFEVAYHDATLEKIFFDEILNGEMIAGRPYIFLPNEGVSALGVYYTDAADEAAGNYHGLYGSYTQEVLAQEAGNYILYNNQYMYVGASSSNVSVGANRAYFKIGVEGGIPTNAVAPLPGRRRVSMSAVRETPTGLENGELINGENGVQKVLINGELFILRGEKMYDATGRLVK